MSPPPEVSDIQVLLDIGGIEHHGARLAIDPIAGGANNRLYRVWVSDLTLVIKEYFPDSRNRLDSEFDFLRYAVACGLHCVPKPLARDKRRGLALFSHLDGSPVAIEQIDADSVGQAGEFVAALNENRASAVQFDLQMGAEACFSIRQHIDCIGGRVDRLEKLVPGDEIDEEAMHFVRTCLAPSWREVSAAMIVGAHSLGLDADEVLDSEQRCISPSDFGFHNALRVADGAMQFFDFEYAGWDDPAKLLCDFAFQVAVPTPPGLQPVFLKGMLVPFPDRDAIAERAQLLMPAYRVKWTCILLNEFLEDGQERRHFARNDRGDCRAAQLDKATRLLG